MAQILVFSNKVEYSTGSWEPFEIIGGMGEPENTKQKRKMGKTKEKIRMFEH